jgi:hypothetical protein
MMIRKVWARDFLAFRQGSALWNDLVQICIGGFMSSRTGKTRMARKVRQARKGKARKRKQQNKGTTPKFPVHID